MHQANLYAKKTDKTRERIHDLRGTVAERLHEVDKAGDAAKAQVRDHAVRIHAAVERRKEAMLKELDRYQVEKSGLLSIQLEELEKAEKELRAREQQFLEEGHPETGSGVIYV